MQNLEDLNETEKQIIDLFLIHKKSIREIAEIVEGYGRTKVNNVLKKYASLSEENALKISLRKISSKQHKEVTQKEEKGITQEELQKIYEEIMSGEKLLRTLAKKYKCSENYIKNRIVIMLKDDEAIEEFNLKILQTHKDKIEEFKNLSHEEKLEVISEKLNKRRSAYKKNTYNIEWLENRFEKLHNFFEERNSKIEKQEGYINSDSYISKDDLYVMLYDYPTLLTTSIQDRLKPIISKLDNELLNSYSITSKVIKENPSILCSSILRTSLQIKILKDTDTLSFAIERPRIFRTSPELMYALIKKWESNGIGKTPFLADQRLKETYGVSKESLQKSYDIREKYGDDEYFKEI